MSKARKYSSDRIKKIKNRISDLERKNVFTQMNLAANISDQMKIRGLNNTSLAKATNRHVSEITRWLSGTHNFTVETLNEIAFVLGVSLEKLFHFEKRKIIFSISTSMKTSLVNDDVVKKEFDFVGSCISKLQKEDSIYNVVGKS